MADERDPRQAQRVAADSRSSASTGAALDQRPAVTSITGKPFSASQMAAASTLRPGRSAKASRWRTVSQVGFRGEQIEGTEAVLHRVPRADVVAFLLGAKSVAGAGIVAFAFGLCWAASYALNALSRPRMI